MNIIGLIKDNYNLYTNKPLIKNYNYYSVEDIQKIVKELTEAYNLNSSINYTNPSFIFPHQFLLDKSDALNNTHNKYQNTWYYMFHIYNTYKTIIFLKKDLEKTNEKLSIHFVFLNKIKKLTPETKTIIEQEQVKIKECFKINQSAIETIKKFIKKNKIYYKEKNIDVADIEYEKLKKIVIYFLNDNSIIEEVENDCSNNKYIGLKYKLDVFFNSKKGDLYISNIINEINNVENKFQNNKYYNPIPEINNIIKKYQFIYKHHMQSQMNMESLSNEYVRILRVKYEYLKKHPIKEEIYNLGQDYKAYDLYSKYIEEDLNKKVINNKIDKYFYDYINEYSVLPNSILYNRFPSTLSLFFAYYSDTLDEWFKNDMENINGYINYLIPYKNIKFRYPLKMSRETYLYLYEYESIEYESIRRVLITNLHKEVVKEKGLNWSILKGIEEITLDNSDTSKNILSLFSLSDKITISKDVKSITIKNIKDFPSGNIIFQDGIEIINMKDVSFQDEITLTIPKSVSNLNLDYSYGNISTLIFEDYDQSPLINKRLIKNIVEEYYNLSPKIKNTYWKDEVIIDTNSHKSIKKIIMKKDNQVLEYCFHPIILENNNSILHLINTARRIAYEEICKRFIKPDKLLSNTSPEEDYPLFTSDEDNIEGTYKRKKKIKRKK